MIDLQALGLAVKQAQWRHHRAMDRRLGAIGTTLVQWDCLRAIDRRPGASAHELAQVTFQSDQAFGTLSTRLLGQGLIERTPGEGRRIQHHLTPAGSEMLAAGLAVTEGFLAETFAPLDEPEREVLLDLLNRLGGDEAAGQRRQAESARRVCPPGRLAVGGVGSADPGTTSWPARRARTPREEGASCAFPSAAAARSWAVLP